MRHFTFAVLLSIMGIFVSQSQAQDMNLFMIDQKKFPNTGCLDNSPSGYYFRPALNLRSKQKWVITLEGGGECVTKRSCTARSTTNYGSSTNWPSSRKPTQLQSDNPTTNPDFYDFNQIFVPYCSGDLFLGQDKSQNERAFGLRFSGFNNLDSVITTLISTHSIQKSDLVIYSGVSAGGIGAVATLDYFVDSINVSTSGKKPIVYGAPIAGFYFDNNVVYKPKSPEDPRPGGYIRWSYDDLKLYGELWNAFVPRRCALDGKAKQWECMFASRSYATLATPIFFTHAQTDSVVMPLHAALPAVWNLTPPTCDVKNGPCPAVIKEFMGTWGTMMKNTEALVTSAVKSGKRKDGMFSAACLIHTSFSSQKPIVNNMSYVQALGNWVKSNATGGQQHLHIDSCFYNTNTAMCGICAPGHH